MTDFLARGIVQLVVPPAELAILGEFPFQLRRYSGHALLGIRLQAESRRAAEPGLRAGLHSLVDQQYVLSLAGGEQRGSKSEAIDVAFHLQHPAFSPDLGDIEWNADDHPAQVVAAALE